MLLYLDALEKYSQDTGHICFPITEKMESQKRFSYNGFGMSHYRYKYEKGALPSEILKVLRQLDKYPNCKNNRIVDARAKIRKIALTELIDEMQSGSGDLPEISKPQAVNDDGASIDEQALNWFDAIWIKSYNAYKKNLLATGESAPPANTIVDGINIECWISKERGLHSGTIEAHTYRARDERSKLLESTPGFTWEIPESQTRGFRKWKNHSINWRISKASMEKRMLARERIRISMFGAAIREFNIARDRSVERKFDC